MIVAMSSRLSSMRLLHLVRTDDRAAAVVLSLQPGRAARARPMAAAASRLPIRLTFAIVVDAAAPGSVTRNEVSSSACDRKPSPSRVGSWIDARIDDAGALVEKPAAPRVARQVTIAADRSLMNTACDESIV